MNARSFSVFTRQVTCWFSVNLQRFEKHNHLMNPIHISCPSNIRSAATIIDGKRIASEIMKELQRDVNKLVEDGQRRPQLATIVVGDDAASHLYIEKKKDASKKVGKFVDTDTRISTTSVTLSKNINEEDLVQHISFLNEDPLVDGILVQLPLPKHINENVIANTINPHKDVDGVNLVNVGRLSRGLDCMVPCTALGVRELILRTEIETKGKHAVVCGRSANVGLPIAMLLHSDSERNPYGLDATTSICHRFTPHEDLSKLVQTADILITATGIRGLITSAMVKEGACVIDVGITRVVDPLTKKTCLFGDVDFRGVKEKVKYITPVPGGVGPMTVAMLMKNTLIAAKRKVHFNRFGCKRTVQNHGIF